MTTVFRGRDSALLASFILAGALAPARTAVAQSASAQAEAMFNEGRALLDTNRVSEACAAFESSQRLGPATSTLLNLAACRERNGQLATAWGLFLDVGRATRAASDGQSKKWHQLARDRAKRLEPRLSKLTIKVPDESRVDRLEIVRGTESIDAAMWNRALPIDGGHYQIRARAPGAPPWAVDVTIGAENDIKVVEIPRLGPPAAAVGGTANAAKARAPESTSSAPSVAAPPSPPREATSASPPSITRYASRPVASTPPSATARNGASGAPTPTRDAARGDGAIASRAPIVREAPPTNDPEKAPPILKTPDPLVPLASNEGKPRDRASSSTPWLPIAVTSGGVLLLGGATGFYLWGSSSYDAARDERLNQQRRDSLERDANGRRHIAMVMGVAGLACGVVAAWLHFHERAEQPSTTSTSARLHVLPVVDDGGAGIAILGAF